MPTQFVIYSYNGRGASMRYLSGFLQAPMIDQHSFDAHDLRNKSLINYGASYLRVTPWPAHWLNRPENISNAIHKLVAFRLFADHRIPFPEWTRSIDIARDWQQEGHIVLARATSTGSEGHGITIISTTRQNLPPAEFYSKFLNHDQEYRVHVVAGQIISVGRKIPREPTANRYIRNMDNGWVFRLNISDAPACVQHAGLAAVNAVGLDFGATDVAYTASSNKAHVLEVNSAPTMSETTAAQYAQAFRRARI